MIQTLTKKEIELVREKLVEIDKFMIKAEREYDNRTTKTKAQMQRVESIGKYENPENLWRYSCGTYQVWIEWIMPMQDKEGFWLLNENKREWGKKEIWNKTIWKEFEDCVKQFKQIVYQKLQEEKEQKWLVADL